MQDERIQYKVLSRAFSFLKRHHREERVAELLLQHHLGVNRSTFYMRMQEQIPTNVYETFQRDVQAHATTGIPVQHLIGYEEFYGRKFAVNEHVLIPRMETEELVAYVIEQVNKYFPDAPVTIADIGTGSGIIATTLALELSQATLYATDISEAALQVAKENATRLEASVQFFKGNFVQPLIEQRYKPHIIVSNPPYIGEQERGGLADTVEKFDPALALFAEEDGLAAYKEILSQVKSSEMKTNMIFFEIGYKQKESVMQLSKVYFPNSTVECIQDINGHDRIIAIFLYIV